MAVRCLERVAASTFSALVFASLPAVAGVRWTAARPDPPCASYPRVFRTAVAPIHADFRKPVDFTTYPVSISVSGSLHPLRIFPAERVTTDDRKPFPAPGPIAIAGSDAAGRVLFEVPLDEEPAGDFSTVKPGAFDVDIPITIDTCLRLRTLTVRYRGRTASETSLDSGPPKIAARSDGRGNVTVRWDGRAYPAGLVLGEDVDRYLEANWKFGFSSVTFPSRAPALTVTLSNRVLSTDTVVRVHSP